MASIQVLLRAVLALFSVFVLVVMVYMNVRAVRHDVAADIGRGGFARMLERSVDRSSGVYPGGVSVDAAAAGAPTGASDKPKKQFGETKEAGVELLEELTQKIEQKSDSLEERLHSLVDDAKRRDKVSNSDAETSSKQQQQEMAEKGQTAKEQQQEQPPKTQPKPQQKGQQQQQQQPPKPNPQPPHNLTGLNILLLYADDWTHHTLSSYHGVEPVNRILKTPVLDALAADGVRFTHNCVTTSVCWISRATLYTGQYMSRHNTTKPCCWSGMEKPRGKLDEAPANWKELSFYELLAEEGYHVGHAGKWGVYLPFDKGAHFNVEADGWHWRRYGKKLWHVTEKNEADALRFLTTRPRDRPFVLNVAFFATHARDGHPSQYQPQNASMAWYADDVVPNPPTATDEAWGRMPWFFDERNEGRTRWHARFDNYTKRQTMMKNYYRMATEVDAACGAILEELRRQDTLDNTVVIFTTDNGNFHGEHGLADKWYPHQESIRVPLIIRDPRMKDEIRGTTNDAITLNIDLAPTILGFAGLPTPEKMMGRDMSPLYLSPTSAAASNWRNDFFYEHPIISAKWYVPSSEALVRRDYKYMYWPDYGYEQLFDLVGDPGELKDIVNSTDPGVVRIKKEMKERFDWLKNLVKSDGKITL